MFQEHPVVKQEDEANPNSALRTSPRYCCYLAIPFSHVYEAADLQNIHSGVHLFLLRHRSELTDILGQSTPFEAKDSKARNMVNRMYLHNLFYELILTYIGLLDLRLDFTHHAVGKHHGKRKNHEGYLAFEFSEDSKGGSKYGT